MSSTDPDLPPFEGDASLAYSGLEVWHLAVIAAIAVLALGFGLLLGLQNKPVAPPVDARRPAEQLT